MSKSLTVALISDTSIYSKNFGCQLVGQMFREKFKRAGLDLKICLPIDFNYRDYATDFSISSE
jgi:hypothetical protein